MIDYDAIPFEVERPRQENGAIIHSFYGRSRWNAEVEAEVRPLGLPIENALRTVNIGDRGVGWRGELAFPLNFRGDSI